MPADPTSHEPLKEHRWARVAGAVCLFALGASMFWQQGRIRAEEATLAGEWFGVLLGGSVNTSKDVVYFSWLNGSAVGMRITAECTVALLTGPLCLFGGVVLAFTRARWQRLLVGLTAGLVAVVLVNQVRLMLIAISMQHWGMPGYDVSHKFVGTVVALVGFVAGTLLMLRIATANERRSPA